ncbi:MAG: bifunctional riboflavin kinase/FAD synthetase [Clostridiales bacterium]|nr:bifunctional riboflavin kinase/FAD synthetase [Clostridiales bacterium]
MVVWNCIINQNGKLISTPSSAEETTASRAVALGFFDGVHLGHQRIFRTMQEVAQQEGLRTAVQTFQSPPASKEQNNLITTYAERCRLISHMKIDDLFALPFDDRVKNMTPEAFMEVCIRDWMRTKAVVVGCDYRFGLGRAGDVKLLRKWGNKNGIRVITVDPVEHEGRRISSSWVRELIASGDVEKAEQLLGHPAVFSGVVEVGQQLGRKLGFPTANIRVSEQKMIPKFGVYASAYVYQDRIYPSITNIGMRPTVNKEGGSPLTETMLFDQHIPLYGTFGTVLLLKFIRPEQEFGSLEELKTQMQSDQDTVRKYHQCRQIPVRFEGYV